MDGDQAFLTVRDADRSPSQAIRGTPRPRIRPGRSPASRSRQLGGRADGILLSGDPAAPVLSAGPAHLGDFVSDVAMIPAQTTRDLLNREAAYEHVAQLMQLPADSGDVARSFRDYVARCSDMMSPG
jgi:hypothetical protein